VALGIGLGVVSTLFWLNRDPLPDIPCPSDIRVLPLIKDIVGLKSGGIYGAGPPPPLYVLSTRELSAEERATIQGLVNCEVVFRRVRYTEIELKQMADDIFTLFQQNGRPESFIGTAFDESMNKVQVDSTEPLPPAFVELIFERFNRDAVYFRSGQERPEFR